ncbi:MAG: carbohydrate transporter substrate-binding protein family, partial [Herbinix sp.]|nr:carbohydrate transporter substrate-binding protein family [Herbinix sp.]
GAPEIPDLFTAYPKTALHFQEKAMLVNFDDYFTEEELSKYVPSFVQEGRFGDNGLYVFPFAKSTEILFLNKTLFDRFSAESDITMEDLATIEGIVQTSVKYYEWTDAKTPDIEDDGKMFFTADSWLNLTQSVFEQHGEELFVNDTLNLEQDTYTRFWNLLYPAVAKGGIAIYDGYSSDLSKTGDLVCSIGSTAGIIFYADTITYSDNTVEEVEYDILPYPIMSGEKKIAIQRGNGLCVTKSTKAKEYAASVFIKWFTNSAQNIRFISSTGYLPVTKDAFQNQLPNEMNQVTDSKVKAMLTASINMYKEYAFFIPPTFEQFDTIGKEYETNLKALLQEAQEAYRNDETNLDQLSEAALKSLIK